METKQVEYKLTLDRNNWQQWLKTFCGFSNAEGGNLLIGYNNGGVFVGMTKQEADATVRYINNMVRQHTEPVVKYTVEYIGQNDLLL